VGRGPGFRRRVAGAPLFEHIQNAEETGRDRLLQDFGISALKLLFDVFCNLRRGLAVRRDPFDCFSQLTALHFSATASIRRRRNRTLPSRKFVQRLCDSNAARRCGSWRFSPIPASVFLVYRGSNLGEAHACLFYLYDDSSRS
jgi:hypothetical protein